MEKENGLIYSEKGSELCFFSSLSQLTSAKIADEPPKKENTENQNWEGH